MTTETVYAKVIALAEGKLYQLPNPYELNGLVSTHPTTAHGYAPLNSYLLLEQDRALLLDTGFSVHQESLFRQLESVIDRATPLEIFPMNIGDFSSICNTRPITERFNVVTYYGIIDGANEWLDFRPEYAPFGTAVGEGAMATVVNAVARSVDALEWSKGSRRLEVFAPPIRLLPSHWAYDPETGALFTNDSFSHVWRQTADGPWTVAPGEEPPSVDHTYDFLVGSRFWWLPGSDTDAIAKDLAAVFENRDVRMIAPKFGCSITDPAGIEAHYELLLATLGAAGRRSASGLRVTVDPVGSQT